MSGERIVFLDHVINSNISGNLYGCELEVALLPSILPEKFVLYFFFVCVFGGSNTLLMIVEHRRA